MFFLDINSFKLRICEDFMETNLLSHPYFKESELPKLDSVSDNIAKFNNGLGIFNGTAHWVDSFINLEKNGEEVFILNKSQFKNLEGYLKSNDFDYNFVEPGISLCCDKSTKNVKTINTKFQVKENGATSNAFFVYSPEKLFTLNVRAYLEGFGRQEELLQRALVQHDIDIRSDPRYVGLIHCSSSFRIFNSPEKANETIDNEMFDYLKKTVANDKSGMSVIKSIDHDTGEFETEPCPLEPPYDGAFISGHEKKYRWPLSLPSKGLTDGKSRNGNLQMICMVGGPPEILAIHSDGKTIVTNDRTDELPLKQYFNPLEGLCFKLGMWNNSVIHDVYVGGCKHCEKEQINNFRNKVIETIDEHEKSGGYVFDMVGDVAKSIGYTINYDNLKIKVVEKEKRFG